MGAARETTLSALRTAIAGLQPGSSSAGGAALFQLGLPALDAALGGGLACGALHEVYARGTQDAAAAAGFGLALGLRAAADRPLVWVRQDFIDAEAGGLYGAGITAFGLDPERLLVVRARDPTSALWATAEAARCCALGAALVEIWGEPTVLDLRASRRLALAAGASGVSLIMMRLGAKPVPSSAASRWSVSAAASTPLAANAPGRPAFGAALLRHRTGHACGDWLLEWDRDRASFAAAPLPRFVVPLPADGPAASDRDAQWRRAG